MEPAAPFSARELAHHWVAVEVTAGGSGSVRAPPLQATVITAGGRVARQVAGHAANCDRGQLRKH